MDKRIKLCLLIVAALVVVALFNSINFAGKADIVTHGHPISRDRNKSRESIFHSKNVRSVHDGRRHVHQTKSPLCSQHKKTIIIFGRMRHALMHQLHGYNIDIENCELPDNVTTCMFTNDLDYYKTADVLYVRDCFTTYNQPGYPGQLVISYNTGPEKKECNNPENSLKVADIRVSYTLSSNISLPYMCWSSIQQPLLNALKLRVPSGKHGIAMFVSDCGRSTSWRYEYLKELMKHIHIDSYGGCLHNTNQSSSRNKGTNKFGPLKLDVIRNNGYKFLMCFENSVVKEYVTEKIWHAYMSQTIPIYYGTKDVYDQVPGNNTFIDATKFAGPKELAEYIKKVDSNETLYKSYFDFDISRTVKFQRNCPSKPIGCAMCKRLYHLKEERCI